ncbi:MAG: hypothetical protein U0M50_05480, partial [Paramuribaculum sp.]
MINHSVLFIPIIAAGVIATACGSSGDASQSPADTTNYAALVNPMIGTDFTGNTYPGAQAPFGMVQLSP